MVPGASGIERRLLGHIGGIVRALVPPPSMRNWPSAIRDWAKVAPKPPAALVDRFRAELNAPDDIFEWIYTRLVSGPNRRRLGTFFTPGPVVGHMLSRVGTTAPARVVDAGAGVGAFATACAKRWPSSEVVAIDLNVVTLGLLAARTALNDMPVSLVHADFLKWIAADRSDKPTVFLGNPPYTRHQGLPTKLKDGALKSTGGLVTSRLAGMSTYFLGAMLAHAKPDDSICVLLPGNWVEARYGLELRQHLWRGRRDLEITAFGTEEDVFPGTRVTATIAWIGPEASTRKRGAVIARRATLGAAQVVEVDSIELDNSTSDPPSFGAILWPREFSASEKTTRLGDIVTVRRGVATGANDFFFLDDNQRSTLPAAASVRAVRRLRHVTSDVLDEDEHDRIGKDHTRWMLWLHNRSLLDESSVASFIAEAPGGIRSRELLRRRGEEWFVVERCDAPTILISTSARGALRAVHNACAAIPSNSMYGIYLPENVDGFAFTLWWNSSAGQAAVLANARHYASGLLKLEPSDVLEIRIPFPPPW